tara:strand:+ start:211 stop:471 length:261 start_codon:yes stop_codon:yes gene_type:complete
VAKPKDTGVILWLINLKNQVKKVESRVSKRRKSYRSQDLGLERRGDLISKLPIEKIEKANIPIERIENRSPRLQTLRFKNRSQVFN